MEYSLCRAMEVNRLSPEQEIQMQTKERNVGRCLMPFEIQEIFGLPLLKIVYGIPELAESQANHNQKLRQQFFSTKLFPEFQYLSSLDIETAHQFDAKLRTVAIDFVFSGGRAKKRMSADYDKPEIEDNHWMDQ